MPGSTVHEGRGAQCDQIAAIIHCTPKSLTFKNPQIQTMVDAAGNTSECITTRQFYVKAPAKIKYTTNGAEFPSSGRDCFLVIDCYDPYGTLNTDNIGGFQVFSCLYYKDP